MVMISDKELLAQFLKHKDIDEYGNANQIDFSRRAHRFYAGDKGIYTAWVSDGVDKQIIVFNKVKPYVDAVAGFFRQIRRKPEYSADYSSATEGEIAGQHSENITAFSDDLRSKGYADQMESAQDLEMLITGMGVIDTNILYDKNPDGAVEWEVVQYDDFYHDPQARAPNLRDARWMRRRKKFSMEEALKRFKGSTEADFDPVDTNPQRKVFNPFDGQYTAIAIDTNSEEDDLVQVNYYQWWQLETYYRANNPVKQINDPLVAEELIKLLEITKQKRGEVEDEYAVDDLFEFDPQADTLIIPPILKNDVILVCQQFGIDLEVQEYLKKCYYTGILSETKVFKKFKNRYQNGFTLKVKTGTYDHELNIWYAMVRQLEEPARYGSKALTEMLYTIAFNSKGGVLYEKSATDDPERFERMYASTKAAIRVNDGALSGAKIQPKANAALPTGFENIYNIANSSLPETSGISKEFLGSSENTQVSALLESQRINQVSSVLANYVDSITLYTYENADLLLSYMRQLIENRPRPVKITLPNGESTIRYLRIDKMAAAYQVNVSEGLPNPAQVAETGTILLGIARDVAMMGQNIYPLLVDYIPGLKVSDKQKLQQLLNPQPDPQQIEQKQKLQQLMLQGQMAKIEKDMADAQEKIANTGRTQAETVRTLTEAHQKDMENQLIKQINPDNINVTI